MLGSRFRAAPDVPMLANMTTSCYKYVCARVCEYKEG
jgi:hypothetical protein